MTWENPEPDKELATVVFVSLGARAAPFLVAITVALEGEDAGRTLQ